MGTKTDRLKELVWPDILGVGAALAGHYLTRGIDYAQGWSNPFKRLQDYAAVGLAAGSAYMYTTNKAPKFAEVLFSSNLTLVGEGAADKVFGPPEETFAGLRARKRVSAIKPTNSPAGAPPTPTPMVPDNLQLLKGRGAL